MDIDKMQEAKAKTVSGLTGGIEHLLKKHKVDYFKGKGSLSGPNGVSVALNDGSAQSLDAKNIILATGSEVTPLPPVPVDNAAGKIVDSTGALEINKIPETMAVVGGGVIGLEMGSVWSRLGTKVTGEFSIVTKGKNILLKSLMGILIILYCKFKKYVHHVTRDLPYITFPIWGLQLTT
mmetsp:Transcript_67139/g.99405  ORF Transcript_67139/g.99405 Transcript_67139/m.99405 type:complete len:179 (-) Transcript_67139:540-1076(-)